VRVDDCQYPQFDTQGQLVMNKIYGPDIIRPDSLLAIVSQLGLHPPFRMLVPKLQT